MTGDELVATDRGRLAVRRAGDGGGPLALLLHGFPDDASTFDALARRLADDGFAVVAPYLRGYAPSPIDGDLELDALADDLFALLDVVSPGAPVCFVGHDYGAQIGYAAMSRAAHRFRSAVLLAGPHPTFVMRNARRRPKQWWMSRYIALFQVPKVSEWIVGRDDLKYIETLWRRWSPGFDPPAAHLAHVKRTIAASMPAPIRMYRAGGFDIGEDPIDTPTLLICGRDDGCLSPELAEGQGALFTADYEQLVWPGTGHFVHLERPQETADAVLGWFARQGPDVAG